MHRFAAFWLPIGFFRYSCLCHHCNTMPLAFGASTYLAVGMSLKHQEVAGRAIVPCRE
jgi:hypothetical protein